jgi:tellurite resistance protein
LRKFYQAFLARKLVFNKESLYLVSEPITLCETIDGHFFKSNYPPMLDPIKVEHFRNLVSLIAADGKIEEIERVTLSKIAFARGIPPDRFNVMLLKANEYKYLIPQNHHEREVQLQEMIDVALVDGDFSKKEIDLIRMVGGKLGFTEAELDAIIEKHRPG